MDWYSKSSRSHPRHHLRRLMLLRQEDQPRIVSFVSSNPSQRRKMLQERRFWCVGIDTMDVFGAAVGRGRDHDNDHDYVCVGCPLQLSFSRKNCSGC